MSSAIKYSFVGILITAVVAIILWGGRKDPVVEKEEPPSAASATPAKDEPNRWLSSAANARSAAFRPEEPPSVPSPLRPDSPVRLVASGGAPESEPRRDGTVPASEERGTLDPAGPAEARPLPAPERSTGSTHVVVAGESLFTIARKYYGSGKDWRRIADANPGVDPDRIKVGARLVIPAASAEVAASPPRNAPREDAPPAPAAGPKTYVVEKGDSLYKIAQKFYGNGNDWRRIRDANSMKDGWEVRQGMKIVIPAR